MNRHLEHVETLLAQIAGKNDLSGCVTPEDLIADAQQALWECELLAREALEYLRSGAKRAPTKGEITPCFRCSGEGAGTYMTGEPWRCAHCNGSGQLRWLATGFSEPA